MSGIQKVQNYMRRGHANPVPTWLFDVQFFFAEEFKTVYGIPNDVSNMDSFTCIKADLPQYENTQKEVNFLGTGKTVNVCRQTKGETVLQFWCRENEKTYSYRGSNVNFLDTIVPRGGGRIEDDWIHAEFIQVLDELQVTVYNSDGSVFRKFRYLNPQVQSFNFIGEMAYEGEAGLKWELKIHYDAWEEL